LQRTCNEHPPETADDDVPIAVLVARFPSAFFADGRSAGRRQGKS
jgi:hypothetical protein